MNWRKRYQDKLRTPEEAVQVIKSGDRVGIPIGAGEPTALLAALAGRKDELRNVSVGPFMSWREHPIFQPDVAEAFRLWFIRARAFPKEVFQQELVDVAPTHLAFYPRQREEGRVDMHQFDVFMVQVSPPNEAGFCSFGNSIWYSKSSALRAKTAIGEVRENFIRTGGDNFIHVSAFNCLVENNEPPQATMRLTREERVEDAEVIGYYVADLIRDGDTCMFGGGSVSFAVPFFLREKRDLAVHSEICPSGAIQLLKEGVLTGACRTVHPGKAVVATSIQGTLEDLQYVNDHPGVALYEVCDNNNLNTLCRIENLVAVNNALAVDLTGQVTAESIGARFIASPGGQMEFLFASLFTPGGRSIVVLPSTARGGAVSSITAQLPEGSVVTDCAAFADYIVTEHGVASLLGKNQRQRAQEIIAIAHPDFRPELEAAARKMNLI